MGRLEVVDSGVMYINRDPAHGHVFASHPSPRQVSDKEFVCVYQRGASLYADDSRLGVLRSRDGGVTWAEEGLLGDGDQDDRPYSYHGGFLSRMRDGSLVVFAFRADRSRPDRRFFTAAGGLIENEPIIFCSEDEGRTWSKPQRLALPAGLTATPAGPILELPGGAWLATFDQWLDYDDPGPYKPRMLACRSGDRGRNWSAMSVMADGEAEGKGFWHGKTIPLLDGRLYTLFWAADMTQPDKGPLNLPLHYAYADGEARQWSRPEATTVPGQTNWPAQLAEGRLCAIYTRREGEAPGFMAVLSEDAGRTWDLERQARVWDATGWTHIGLSSPDKYPRSHDTIAFGAPTLMVTRQGDLYASWWCTLASLTHLRWARLRVTS